MNRSIVDIVVDVLVEDAGLNLQPSFLVVKGNDGFIATLATQGAVPEAPRSAVVKTIAVELIDIRSTPRQSEVSTGSQFVGEAIMCSKTPCYVCVGILLSVAQTTPVASSSIGDAMVIAQTSIEVEILEAHLLDEVSGEV